MKVYIVLLVLSVIAVALADHPACNKQRKEAQQSKDPNAYVPNCYPNGDYKAEQCRKSEGGTLFCFCVNKAGEPQGPPKQGHRSDCH
ncbi:U20-hexatoxin-Hi1a [Parasteatoda tepidariorum]|uniref:U20-hexatoxin-Hi1a n=1 Tax=Parasteatoda tepidariorum TaxID=114398 RepID=UPI00077F99A0|nr:saxiphilin [Parasteatoda tepidariorum]